MASDIGEKAVTVRQWRNRNSVPVRYWPKIIAAAGERGAAITAGDIAQACAAAAAAAAARAS